MVVVPEGSAATHGDEPRIADFGEDHDRDAEDPSGRGRPPAQADDERAERARTTTAIPPTTAAVSGSSEPAAPAGGAPGTGSATCDGAGGSTTAIGPADAVGAATGFATAADGLGLGATVGVAVGLGVGRAVGRAVGFATADFATGTGWIETYRPSQIIGFGSYFHGVKKRRSWAVVRRVFGGMS